MAPSPSVSSIVIGEDGMAGQPGSPKCWHRGPRTGPYRGAHGRSRSSHSAIAKLTVTRMAAGVLEGIVLKDRRSTYRDGSPSGWSKVKDPSWYQREVWRFERRLRQ